MLYVLYDHPFWTSPVANIVYLRTCPIAHIVYLCFYLHMYTYCIHWGVLIMRLNVHWLC